MSGFAEVMVVRVETGMSAELIQLIERLGKPKVLVVGDIILDRYIWGDAERISQEAPVILLRADKREERLGGASSVATMLVHLQAEVALAGVIGVDSDAEKVRQAYARDWPWLPVVQAMIPRCLCSAAS